VNSHTHPGPLPVPARITAALDIRELHGDQVDRDLGVWTSPAEGWEPGTAVDRWEDGTLVPTHAEVLRLAALTAFPADWFYRPVEDFEQQPTRTFLCERRRRPENALTVVDSHIDEHGVLHVDEVTPPKPPYHPRPEATVPTPRRARPQRRGAHAFTPDPRTPSICGGCQMPRANARHVPLGDLPPAGDDPQTRAAGDRGDRDD